MRKKRAFLKIFKIFAIIAAASFAVSVIFAAVCVITIEVKNYNKYDKALMIDIPERGADLHKDTHGGFHGDGEIVKMYELSDKEADNLIAEIKISGVWKNIDDEANSLLYGERGAFAYRNDRIPPAQSGFYCVYDKQTGRYGFPTDAKFSFNYIIGVYSEDDKKLWIYELDT